MENTKKNSHNQIENCPCYPQCDEMMTNSSEKWNQEGPFWPPLSPGQIPSYDPTENPVRMNSGMEYSGSGRNYANTGNDRTDQDFRNPWSDSMVNSWNNMNSGRENPWNDMNSGSGNSWNRGNSTMEMPRPNPNAGMEAPWYNGNGGMEIPWNSGNGTMEMPRSTGNAGMEMPWNSGNGSMEMPRSTGNAGMDNSWNQMDSDRENFWNNRNESMHISPNYYNQSEERSMSVQYEGTRMNPVRNGSMPMPSYQNIIPQSYQSGPADQLLDEQENDRDMDRIKNMYPEIAKSIQQYAEEVCDDLEYPGSPMFDEQPDKINFQKLVKGIMEKMDSYLLVEEKEDKDDILAMNKESRRRYPPGQNWLNDFIEVMLYQEMFRRRCRHRNCRPW